MPTKATKPNKRIMFKGYHALDAYQSAGLVSEAPDNGQSEVDQAHVTRRTLNPFFRAAFDRTLAIDGAAYRNLAKH